MTEIEVKSAHWETPIIRGGGEYINVDIYASSLYYIYGNLLGLERWLSWFVFVVQPWRLELGSLKPRQRHVSMSLQPQHLVGGRDRKLARVCSSPSLAKLVRSRFNDRYWEQLRKVTNVHLCPQHTLEHICIHVPMCTCIYTYTIYSIKKEVRGEEQSYRGLQKNIAGTLRNTCERKTNTRSSGRDHLTPLTHTPVIPLNISCDVNVQSRSSAELSVDKLLTVYEMWWSWVETFIPFWLTSTGTYEQDTSFGNMIFTNVLQRRSFWASIKLIKRPVSLLVWGNVNRYTDYEVMWSWEAKRQEWADVTTNQAVSGLTGGPQSWTDCRTHFSSGGFWIPHSLI